MRTRPRAPGCVGAVWCRPDARTAATCTPPLARTRSNLGASIQCAQMAPHTVSVCATTPASQQGRVCCLTAVCGTPRRCLRLCSVCPHSSGAGCDGSGNGGGSGTRNSDMQVSGGCSARQVRQAQHSFVLRYMCGRHGMCRHSSWRPSCRQQRFNCYGDAYRYPSTQHHRYGAAEGVFAPGARFRAAIRPGRRSRRRRRCRGIITRWTS